MLHEIAGGWHPEIGQRDARPEPPPSLALSQHDGSLTSRFRDGYTTTHHFVVFPSFPWLALLKTHVLNSWNAWA